MIDLQHARLIVSRDALLSPTMTARLIGGRGALQWVRDNVPIRMVAGRPRVRWGDVIAAAPPVGLEEARPGRIRVADY